MPTATQELLSALDPLPHPERMRRLAAWARTAPDRAEVGAELRGGGFHERYLALSAAVMAGDRAGIEAGRHDPDPGLRIFALRSALRAGLPVEPADLSAAERRQLYRTLRRLPATGVADGMIAEVRERFGDDEAAALLPACGPATVRDLLPDLEHAANLTVMARRHPAIVLDRVEQRLAVAGAEERDRIWAATAGAVLRCEPGRVLDLLTAYAPAESLPGEPAAYGRLAAHDPGRVADLLAARGRWLRSWPLPRAVLRRLAGLPDERLAPLLRSARHQLTALLAAVAPARREGLYDQVRADLPFADLLDVLPAWTRIREATRALARPDVRDSEDLQLFYRSHLAWPEAEAAIGPALRSGSADRRQRAYELLVHAAHRTRDPAIVRDVVDRLTALRNESDPVRSAALYALAGAARLLTAGAAPALTRLTTDAAETRDGSVATSAALATLATDTLRHHAGVPELREWALHTIDLVGSVARVPLLRVDQPAEVAERLHGWVSAAAARGRYGPLFALTEALGRLAWRVPALQDLLRAAIRLGTSAAVARRAIALWLADPATRASRVAEVLATDPSAYHLAEVWDPIARSRTDLIDPVFRDRPAGRFAEAGRRWVPPRPRHPERWAPRQHARFVELHEEVLADPDAAVRSRAASLAAVAVVPDQGRHVLPRFVDAPEVVIAEAALAALPWTDRPDEALPVLLEYADADRARVALHAAARAARFVTPARLPALLGGLLAGPAKVTSRREAARLLGAYGPPSVMATLLTVHVEPSTHRDVRAAIVSAARRRLGAEPSWQILAAAATGSREEIEAVLDGKPGLMAERHRRRYAGLIVAACRSTDRWVRQAAFARLPAWAPWTDGVTELVVDRLTDLAEDRYADMSASLIQATGGAGLTTVFTRLTAHDEADRDEPAGLPAAKPEDVAGAAAAGAAAAGAAATASAGEGDRPAGPMDDRPARRRITRIAGGVAGWARSHPAADRSAAVAAARRLGEHPGFTAEAATMLLALGRLDNLDEIADLCAGRPVLATRTADEIARRLPGEDPAPEVAARLAVRGDLPGGLFAVAVARHGRRFGWPAPWRAVVRDLRHHPEAEVRRDAYAVDLSG